MQEALRAVLGIEAGMKRKGPEQVKWPMSRFRAYAKTAGWG